MFEGARVVVVVPAFEEAPRIGRVIESMPAFVDEIFVVDDASTDATADVVLRTRARLIRHERNRGVGAAVVTGYRAGLEATRAPNDAIAVMAGDGQMHPDDLEAVVRPVVRGSCDYAKGNRFATPYRACGMPLGRKIGGALFSRMTSLAIDRHIEDSQCGFTAIARSALGLLDLDGVYPRFGYPNDLLGQIASRGLRIREVPVRPVYDGEESKLRVWHLAPIALLIARAALRVRFRV
jgi:glycosyltransferase involved in cell wall biosynthesis